jgi:hypothetical protein
MYVFSDKVFAQREIYCSSWKETRNFLAAVFRAANKLFIVAFISAKVCSICLMRGQIFVGFLSVKLERGISH